MKTSHIQTLLGDSNMKRRSWYLREANRELLGGQNYFFACSNSYWVTVTC